MRQSSIRLVANKPIVQSNLSLNAFHRSADRMVEIIRQHLTQHHYSLNGLGDRRYRRRSSPKMLLQAFYSIRSERQLMERLEYDFLGRNLSIFSPGSNGRVRGRAAVNLGWLPAHRLITRWIARPSGATNATPYC